MAKPTKSKATKLTMFRIYSLVVFFIMVIGAIFGLPVLTIGAAIIYTITIMVGEMIKWFVLMDIADKAEAASKAKSAGANGGAGDEARNSMAQIGEDIQAQINIELEKSKEAKEINEVAKKTK